MLRKTVLFLSVMALITGSSYAQSQRHCYTDEVHAQNIKDHPEILLIEKDIEKAIQENLKKIDLNKYAKTTYGDTIWYDVPCVVHIIHDYGIEDLSDYWVDSSVADWNLVYAGSNPDTSDVIPPFKKYIGNPRIRLHLATKDPFGNPTHGITRHRSYLTNNGGENAKLDDWTPTSYLNVWSVNQFGVAHFDAEAYAYYPSAAASIPYYDGAITRSDGLGYSGYNTYNGKVIVHEMSHLFNLVHTFGGLNQAGPTNPCGDDGVDDTPPTKGNQNNCPLYDTACAIGYLKVYPSSIPGIDSLVDYPDTCNVQNVMNYGTCARMYTKGQVDRMHAALQSSIAGRSNLCSPSNLALTGALAPRPDLPAIPDFSVTSVYSCVGSAVTFVNHSWQDTVKNVHWSFSNGAGDIDYNATGDELWNEPSLALGPTTFMSSGWVTVTQTAKGNNTSAGTLVDNTRLYIADATPTEAVGYYQEFNPGSDLDKFPMFNYYNNEFKWELANVGFYDNTSIMYLGYDTRINYLINSFPVTGSPKGDFDDFYTPYFDLHGLISKGTPSLNFMYSGASRAGNYDDMNDSLVIYYQVNCKGSNGSADLGVDWTPLTVMSKGQLDNRGSISMPFAPSWSGDWSLKSIPLNDPVFSAPNVKVAFLFRYLPGVNILGYTKSEGYSTGNNFFLDRINFSNYPLGINTILPPGEHSVALAPNPTNGDAYVVVKDVDGTDANVQVTDIAGRVVYSSTQQVMVSTVTVKIPRSVIPTAGIYLVNVSTPNQTHTEKLVVY